MKIRFLHAFPNVCLPRPDQRLAMYGVTAEQVSKLCQDRAVISHVRYGDHAARLSSELGINLPSSGSNAPTPFECRDMFIVASLPPGQTNIIYVAMFDASNQGASQRFQDWLNGGEQPSLNRRFQQWLHDEQ